MMHRATATWIEVDSTCRDVTGRYPPPPRRAPRNLRGLNSSALCRSFDYWIPEPSWGAALEANVSARISAASASRHR